MPATRRQGRRELRGRPIILVLATAAGGIFFFDRLDALFHRTYTILAAFTGAPGLRLLTHPRAKVSAGEPLEPALRSLAARARALQSELAELQKRMGRPATAARLREDSALQRAASGAHAQLDSPLAEARERPWRFVL